MKTLYLSTLITLIAYGAMAQKALYQNFNFPIGFAINPRLMKKNASYHQIVSLHANTVTAENAMKVKNLQPQEGVFTFDDADYVVNFAKSQGKRVHGHTLVWYHPMASPWMKEIRDSATLENALKKHIQTVVKHFKGKVTSWDVVNEAFDDDDGLIRTDSLNHNKQPVLNLGKILGKDYVPRMFIYAHEADPNALLFYNDYGQENKPNKQKAILSMVQDFKKRNIPIHGLGLQMHTHSWIDPQKIEKVIEESAQTGLLVHISELDVLVNKDKKEDYVYSDEEKAKQAQIFSTVITSYLKYVPKNQQYGITMWNVSDADSWLTINNKREGKTVMDYPLLFDHNYQLKPIAIKAFLGK